MARWEFSFPERDLDEPDPYPGGRPEYIEPHFCDRCGGDVHLFACSSPLGLFCSRACADADEADFTERMKRKGFMEVQPDLLTHVSAERTDEP